MNRARVKSNQREKILSISSLILTNLTRSPLKISSNFNHRDLNAVNSRKAIVIIQAINQREREIDLCIRGEAQGERI